MSTKNKLRLMGAAIFLVGLIGFGASDGSMSDVSGYYILAYGIGGWMFVIGNAMRNPEETLRRS